MERVEGLRKGRKMKKVITICLLALLILMVGCESLRPKGFSIGVVYLNTDVETTSTNRLGNYGQLSTKDTTSIEGFLPIALLNFEYE